MEPYQAQPRTQLPDNVTDGRDGRDSESLGASRCAASLPNKCFTGGRFAPADAASSGHPRRGRFSTAPLDGQSGAPSRLLRFGVQSRAPVQTSPLTPISAIRIGTFAVAPEADRGYPVAHERTAGRPSFCRCSSGCTSRPRLTRNASRPAGPTSCSSSPTTWDSAIWAATAARSTRRRTSTAWLATACASPRRMRPRRCARQPGPAS